MNPRQLSLVVVLALITTGPTFAEDASAQGGQWRSSPAGAATSAASSTLSGTLYRNTAHGNGIDAARYQLIDRWGQTRGYVAVTPGVDLEGLVGQPVTLQGTLKTLPGGDMPVMTCQRVLGDNGEPLKSNIEPAAPPRRKAAIAVKQDYPSWEPVNPGLPTRSEMSAEPVQHTAVMPLHEVVLEPRAVQADDDSEDVRTAAPNGSNRHLPDPRVADRRRTGRPVAQATNYQESIPTPPSTKSGTVVEGRRSPTPDPEMEPNPMAEGQMEEGPMMSQGPMMESGEGCETCGDGQCNRGSCWDLCDEPCWGPRQPLFTIGPTGIWMKADYLQWWEKGTAVPPLVTSGPNAANPGYIGTPGTVILFGGDYINDKSESGGRIQAGMWLNRCATFGIEGEYFALADQNTDYYMWSDGNPIVSRPFYDVGRTTPVENVELVAFPRGSPQSLDGAINVGLTTRFHGAGAHFLFTTCRQEGCWSDECSCKSYMDRFRADFIVGYRYLELQDELGITETLTTTSPTPIDPTDPEGAQGVSAFLINDQFNTQNIFNGVDLGMKFEFQRNRWNLDVFPRIALGSTHQTVDINGITRTTSPSGVETFSTGGLLALPTNIGHYEQNVFTAVPEIDMKVGFEFTPHTRIEFGYNCIYWSRVARAGEQIDRTVNSTLLPNSGVTPIGDTTRPAFSFQETGFWAQGINVGVDCRW